MMKKSNINFPPDILEQAQTVYNGWKELQKQLMVPNMTLQDFEEKMKIAEDKIEAAQKVRTQWSEAIKTRNVVLESLWALTKRIRNAAKATFGDNSKEMDKFGGRTIRFQKMSRSQK